MCRVGYPIAGAHGGGIADCVLGVAYRTAWIRRGLSQFNSAHLCGTRSQRVVLYFHNASDEQRPAVHLGFHAANKRAERQSASPQAIDPGPLTYIQARLNAILTPLTTYTVTLTGCPNLNADGATCASALQNIVAGTFQTGCTSPVGALSATRAVAALPIPPSISLSWPPPGSSVPASSLNRIIVVGNFSSQASFQTTVSLTTSGPIPRGSPGPPILPLASPLANPNPPQPPQYSLLYELDILNPNLTMFAPGVQYNASYTWLLPNAVPPACGTLQTVQMGSFTTQ